MDLSPVVVMSERLGPPASEEQRLLTANAAVRHAPLWTLDDISRQADADVLIVGAVEPLDGAALQALERCRAVIRHGVGVDNVDIDAATRLGMLVANVPDASIEEVSEHALALLLALERRLVPLNVAVRTDEVLRSPAKLAGVRGRMRRLDHLTLGVVGFGRIGQALARKAAPLYRDVLIVDPWVSAAAVAATGAGLVAFDQLVRDADHISLHVPLTPATRHLVDRAVLQSLRPGAVLVNTARGGIIDEAALVVVLSGDHQLGGVALDTTEHDPLALGDPLLDVPGLVLTGHSASSSIHSTPELRRRSVDAALAILSGRRPASIVNPEVLSAPNARVVLQP